MPVDDVAPVDQRDSKARLLDGDPLNVVGLLDRRNALLLVPRVSSRGEDSAAQYPSAGQLADLLHGVRPSWKLIELADLLLERHPPKQLLNARILWLHANSVGFSRRGTCTYGTNTSRGWLLVASSEFR
jgi:hypothetical protein